MIIVDRALALREEAGDPIRVGLIGAGFMGGAIAKQIVAYTPGMRLVAIANRTPDKAIRAYSEAGASSSRMASSASALREAMEAGVPAVTDDPSLLAEADGIDALIEVTGAIEYAARVVTRAIDHGKHVVLMNAELDATIGPVLQRHAQRAGVVVTASDGDQPGVEANLYRFVKGIGLEPLLCGNVKGFHDRYRNPETQAGFAAQWNQSAYMVTSFADGTKVSFEQAVVANATGMRVSERGMKGAWYEGHVDDLAGHYDVDELRAAGGIVDYVVGPKPAPGVFVLAASDDSGQRQFLDLYKLGKGPLYSFYTPYHLCHFEVPNSVARAVLFKDPVAVPLGGPVVGVITAAKRDLAAGEVLDGFGGFLTYGLCENQDVIRAENLLPMGLAEGCRLKHPLPRDAVLTFDDVELPAGRLCDALWREQEQTFGGASAPLVGAAAMDRAEAVP